MNWNNIKAALPIIAVVAALCLISWLSIRNQNLKKDYSTAVINNKAFIAQLDSTKNETVVFQATIDQLSYFNDSVTQQLLKAKDELKIKDNKVNQLARIASQAKKVDTVVFTDTIFRNPTINIDTVIGDKWMSTELHMHYPGTVAVTSKAKSVKNVVLYSEKQTVNPPKKFFLARWLQKKHTVIKAVVNEENPYIESQENTFYDIVK